MLAVCPLRTRLTSLALCLGMALLSVASATAQAGGAAPLPGQMSAASARSNVLSRQATREPFVSPNGRPVLPGLPRDLAKVGAPAPEEKRPEGQALEQRPQVDALQQPAFAGQTRAPAHTTRTPLEARVVARGLAKPWGLAFLPDGRMLISEKPGRLRIVTKSGQLGKPIAGVPPVLYQGDAGLLDVVLDPAFRENRQLYFAFVGYRPDGNALMVASAQLSADEHQLERVTQLLTLPAFENSAHYGGRLLIGHDGKLYVGASERMFDTTRLAAQDPKSPMGKVLRINTDGSVPGDNPYFHVPGADPTVYTLGNRDVQGFALQPGTHALWITDHGPKGGDELDLLLPGRNYGWPLVAYGTEYDGRKINEGRTQWPGTEQPVYYWDPSIAPSGATFYAGDLIPEWRSDLFVAALAGRYLSHLVIRGDKVVGEERLLQEQKQRVRDVHQGPDGALWVITDDEKDGRLIRLGPARHPRAASRQSAD